MWLKQDQFREINQAVARGESKSLLKLLADFFRPNEVSQHLSSCPQCHKPLERKMHPFLELFVQACPDRHGAWLSPDVCSKVRDLVEKQVTEVNQKKEAVKRGVLTVFIAAAVLILISMPGIFRQVLNRTQWSQFQEESPLLRGFPPLTDLSAVANPDERAYLKQTAVLLEKGASERVLFLSAFLQTGKGEDRTALFSAYLKKNNYLSAKLRAVYVPPRLAEFNQLLLRMAASEAVFYALVVQDKTKPEIFSADRKAVKQAALADVVKANTQARECLERLFPLRENAWAAAYEVRLDLFGLTSENLSFYSA